MKVRVALLLLLPAACTVGPDYQQPKIAVPERYLEAPDRAGESDLTGWWRGFGDAQLADLVERALQQNLDMAAAAARIRETRALEQAAGAEALPRVDAQGSITRQRISENAIPVPPGAGGGTGNGFGLPGSEFTSWRVGFDASWELDLFGRTRRLVEAARSRTGAAIWDRRDTEVSVAAEVASAYLRLRTLQARIASAETELARQQRFEELIAARAKGGLVTGQDLEQQRSERSQAAAAIPALQGQARAEIHALGVLTGATPDALAGALSPPRAIPTSPQVPAGLPSDLLRRRPDIRSAERELAAATADIGVAVADLYPRFSLTAAPALVSTALGSLLEWGSRNYAAGAALDWPLFGGGRRATVAARTARQEQAMVAFRKTILLALQEVEDALSRTQSDREQLANLERSLGNAARAEAIARTRHRGGLVTYTDVLLAQARRIAVEQQAIETRGTLARDTVALVKALGGGWKEETP